MYGFRCEIRSGGDVVDGASGLGALGRGTLRRSSGRVSACTAEQPASMRSPEAGPSSGSVWRWGDMWWWRYEGRRESLLAGRITWPFLRFWRRELGVRGAASVYNVCRAL